MYSSNEPAAMCISCALHPGPFRNGQTVTKGSILNDNDLTQRVRSGCCSLVGPVSRSVSLLSHVDSGRKVGLDR